MSTNCIPGIRCRICGCEIENGQAFVCLSATEYLHIGAENCVAAALKGPLAALRAFANWEYCDDGGHAIVYLQRDARKALAAAGEEMSSGDRTKQTEKGKP